MSGGEDDRMQSLDTYTHQPLRTWPYRAFWTTDSPTSWTDELTRQAAAWLAPKFASDVDLRRDGVIRGEDGKRLEVRHHERGNETALRFGMDESNSGGKFSTTLTAVESTRGGGWVALEIAREGGGWVNRPKLAGYLLDVISLRDVQPMSSAARPLRVNQVPELVKLLSSAERQSPVLVAATDDRLPFDSFLRKVTKWSREVFGLAHVIVLDPAASAAFDHAVGSQWATPAWTLRTYLPRIDLSTSQGARANRILGTERLARRSDNDTIRLLGLVARDIVERRPTPLPLLQWTRRFERLGTAAISQAAIAVRPPRPSATEPRTPGSSPTVAPTEPIQRIARLEAELGRVQATLGLPDLSEATLLDLLDLATAERVAPAALADLQDQLTRLQSRADALSDEAELAKLERLEAETELETADKIIEDQARRLKYLTRALADTAGRPDLAYGGTPPDDEVFEGIGAEPIDYAELIERLPLLETHRVIFTGDPKVTASLQALDVDGKALQRAWEALATLCDYIRAKESGDAKGSVHKFLEDQPVGYRSFPVTKHAATETGYTKTHHGDERSLPVPASVDVGGFVSMYEHFKLARISRQDPRLYYLDDTSKSGNVYVGYIGPHMTNSQTET